MVKQITCQNKKKARKLKEGMRKILRNLKRIQEYEKNGNKISELDTQILLVESVLCLAGYDIYNPYIVKRASRSKKGEEFDIEVYNNKKLFLAIEVKSLFSKEFNIGKMSNGIGRLDQKDGKFTNKDKDGVGQLRVYCLNWKKLNSCTIPILTNGEEWVLFNLCCDFGQKCIKRLLNFQSGPRWTQHRESRMDFCRVLDRCGPDHRVEKSGEKRLPNAPRYLCPAK